MHGPSEDSAETPFRVLLIGVNFETQQNVMRACRRSEDCSIVFEHGFGSFSAALALIEQKDRELPDFIRISNDTCMAYSDLTRGCGNYRKASSS